MSVISYFLVFLLVFFQGMSYAGSCEEAFFDSGELFSNPKSFAEAMTKGLVLREGQNDLLKIYLQNWTPYFENSRDHSLQSVFDILKHHPSLSKIPLRDYIFEFTTVRKERPQSLSNFITAFTRKSHRIQNNLFQVEANLGFWFKMLKGNDYKEKQKVLREKKKQDFIAWLDTTALNKELWEFLKDHSKSYRERTVALYTALKEIRADFLTAEQRADETLPVGFYQQTIQRISQAMVDLIYTSGFRNKLWMSSLKDPDPQENLNALRSLLMERDSIALELGFMGNFAELGESLKVKVPNDAELLQQITEEVRNQSHTIERTEALRLRRLSLQESPFRSCMGGDCATNTYFERALDPNFLYFTLTDSGHKSSGHITVVLGEAFNSEGKTIKTAFVDKIQNINAQRLEAVLEGIRLSLQEKDYVLALPKVIGGDTGLSNTVLINSYIESRVLPELRNSLTGFKPHEHNLSISDKPIVYSRAYQTLDLLEFEGARLERVKITPGDFPTLRLASADLKARALYAHILSFEKSQKDVEQMEYLNNFLILKEVFNLSNLAVRNHLYFVMKNKNFSFNVRKRAFYILIEIEPTLQATENSSQIGVKKWDVSFFKEIISNEESVFFSESEQRILLGEMSNWKNTIDYRKEFIKRFSDSFVDISAYEFSQVLENSLWVRILDKDYMLIKIVMDRFNQIDNKNKVFWLLERGADPNARNGVGETVLIWALRFKNIEAVKLLLERGADPNARNGVDGDTALIWVLRFKNIEVVKLLLEKGADPDARSGIDGDTALIWALLFKNMEALKLLLENGADPNARNNVGETALMWALRFKNIEAVKLLLERGADPNTRNAVEDTALMKASKLRNIDVLQLLLERGADPNVRSGFDGDTVLMGASKFGNIEAVELLLERGADPNARNNVGETALMRASKFGNIEIVKLLLERGAEQDASYNNQDVPYNKQDVPYNNNEALEIL